MSSSDDDDDAYVPYAERPEWADVVPIVQPESANPVVLIDYAREYVDAMNTWRAVYASNERSERVLDLTREIIRMNGGAYTVWHHRWELVRSLGVDLAEEMRYAGEMSRANPKNYQVWNHMRLCSQAMKHSGNSNQCELAGTLNEENTRIALMMDAKNIHAWTQRAWAVRTFNQWESEMTFTERMIDDDVRNNSAWNQRFVCVHDSPDGGGLDGEEGAKRAEAELAFAAAQLEKSRHNESAWNYIRGILKKMPDGGWGWRGRGEAIARKHLGDLFGTNLGTSKSTGETSGGSSSGGDETPCRHAACLLAECLLATGEFRQAGTVFAALTHIDPVRANYHAFRRAHALGDVAPVA